MAIIDHRMKHGIAGRHASPDTQLHIVSQPGGCRAREARTPMAILLSIREYVRLASPEPEVLRVIGEESQRKGTDNLTSRQIEQAIKAARVQKPKPR